MMLSESSSGLYGIPQMHAPIGLGWQDVNLYL